MKNLIISLILVICSHLFMAKSPLASPSPSPYKRMTCTECHDEDMKGAVKHKPAVENCLKCHIKHDETITKPKLLRGAQRNINEYCLIKCHSEKPIHEKFPSIKLHSMKGNKDKISPGKPHTCLSCHMVHSSDAKGLFRYKHGQNTPFKGNLCLTCHWEKGHDKNTPAPKLYYKKE